MDNEEVFAWLVNEYNISEIIARDMISQAVRYGDSGNLGGVFITYDGRVFNIYT